MRLASVLVALLLIGSTGTALHAENGVKWTSDFDAAKKAAAEQKKRLFIEFTAEW